MVVGPNGNVHAGGERGTSVTTPGGTAAAGSRGALNVGPGGVTIDRARGGVAAGPEGVVAGGSRTGVAAGSGGVVAGRERGAVAVGPYGAVAGGTRTVRGIGANGGLVGTRYVSAANLSQQGIAVRRDFRYYNAFTPGWYTRYPGAWYAAGWAAGTAWNALPWGGYSSYLGYPAEVQPVYYDYGDTIVYQDGQVYQGDQPIATEAEYSQQATQIAEDGRQATPAADDSWQPLGVFALVQGDATTSNDIFQLAINKDGVVRGNYYNAIADSTQPVSGSLDKASQRLAWTIGDRSEPVYETGLYNLTQEQTTLLAHYGEDHTEQYNLFRVERPEDQEAEPNG